MKAMQISHYGAAEQMQLVELDQPTRNPGEVLVKVIASGVNFIDTYQRAGVENYQKPLPFVMGLEGSGEVIEADEDSKFLAGDVVAWPFSPGSYAELAVVSENKLVKVPKAVTAKTAAAVMLQGLTAHYLANSTLKVNEKTTALVHAGSGGVGQLLVQMIKNKGGRVIATTSTEEKKQALLDLGSDEVIGYEGFAGQVRELTQGNGVDVVYDGVGKNTYMQSLESLQKRGLLALFGASSGPVPAMDLQLLNSMGSLFITRPTLADYIATEEELASRSRDIFSDIELGNLNISIHHEYSLANAAAAHKDLESRKTSGKLLLIP